MLITKFNKMIRSKVLWTFFAVVISVSFVGAFSNTDGCTSDAYSGPTAGTLFGKPVPRHEFALARHFTLGLRERSLKPHEQQIVNNRTWQRIVSLKKAPQLGVAVTPKEVADVLFADPNFQDNGVFSNAKYQQLIRQQMNIDIPTFERYVTEEMTLRKMSTILEAAAWTAPSEIDRRLRNLTDKLTVQYATLATNQLVPSASVEPQAVRAFYDNNSELFTIPDRASVRYVEFPYSNFLASAKIDDAEARGYYEDHIADYEITETNGQKRTLAFEEVSTNIVEILRSKHGEDDARSAANSFTIALTPNRGGIAPSFEALATATGLVVHTTDLFSAKQAPASLDVGPSFLEAAFRLDGSDPESYFSDPVIGINSVYVMATNRFIPSRLPPFEEVADKVKPYAVAAESRKLFVAEAQKVRKAVLSEVQQGKPFDQAIALLSKAAVTTITFTAYDAIVKEMDLADILVPAVGQLQPGEVTDPLPVREGAILACVSAREPGEALSMAVTREELVSTLNKYRSSTVFQEWQRCALKQGGHVDHMGSPVPADEQETSDQSDSSKEESQDL